MQALRSKYFTIEQLTKTTVRRFDEQWLPSDEVVGNLSVLCENVLDRLYKAYGNRLIITSVYRCKRVNTAVGGSKTSQHVKGMAVDFEVLGLTNIELMRWVISQGFKFDQLIEEFGRWVHISYDRNRLRGQKLIAKKVNGEVDYIPFK